MASKVGAKPWLPSLRRASHPTAMNTRLTLSKASVKKAIERLEYPKEFLQRAISAKCPRKATFFNTIEDSSPTMVRSTAMRPRYRSDAILTNQTRRKFDTAHRHVFGSTFLLEQATGEVSMTVRDPWFTLAAAFKTRKVNSASWHQRVDFRTY